MHESTHTHTHTQLIIRDSYDILDIAVYMNTHVYIYIWYI